MSTGRETLFFYSENSSNIIPKTKKNDSWYMKIDFIDDDLLITFS